jgi:ankyrin repeat protein
LYDAGILRDDKRNVKASQAPSLYYASLGGLLTEVESPVTSGAGVDAQDGTYGNTLQAALYKGNEKVVEILLAKCANANSQSRYYGNALQAASYKGNEKIVEMLLLKVLM